MAHTSDHHGSIVTLEGSPDVVSTQLRLLPNNHKILALPPLRYFIDEDDKDIPFDARSYILKIHQACQARNDMAQSFLQEASMENQRIVFMNGGTASAMESCIDAISHQLYKGDHSRAESTFNELVRNGVTGLRQQRAKSSKCPPSNLKVPPDQKVCNQHFGPADHIVRAMKAADALDVETASLQPKNDMDLTITTRERRMSIPPRRLEDDMETSVPFYVFGAKLVDEAISIPDTPRRPLSDADVHVPVSDSTKPACIVSQPIVQNCLLHPMVEAGLPAWARTPCKSPRRSSFSSYSRSIAEIDELLSPYSGTFGSSPGSPAVVYGEGLLVDVRASLIREANRQHKRIRSVDRVYTGATWRQDISLANSDRALTSLSHSAVNTAQGEVVKSDRPKLPLRASQNVDIPRSKFANRNKPNTRRTPPHPLDLTKAASTNIPNIYIDRGTSPVPQLINTPTWIISSYVDRGVDALDIVSPFDKSTPTTTLSAFEPVLPICEDLVIHLHGEEKHDLLHAVIRRFERGCQTVVTSDVPAEGRGNSDAAVEPSSNLSRSKQAETSVLELAVSPVWSEDGDECYTFVSDSSYLQPCGQWKNGAESERENLTVLNAPPTPARMSPGDLSVSKKTYHEIKTTSCATAVAVQNRLRFILNAHFSHAEVGQQKSRFTLLPELSNIWKPVFSESGDHDASTQRRKVDLILAVGAQRGVPGEFLSALTSSLEKLGVKPNGVTRTGRLDLKYLIANAIQSYTCQPLSKQTQDNPFTNPLLLATLIIPHLETYLAHNATRFLILDYPAEHLSTVLALQRLVGVDIIKVAGILGTEGRNKRHKNDASISSTTSTNSMASASLITSRSKPMRSAEAPSFSKANFLLTSSATELEIATLIATIWKVLIEISDFYIPDGVPRSASRSRLRDLSSDTAPISPPLSPPTSEYPPLTSARVMMGFQRASAPPSIAEPSVDPETKPAKAQVKRSSASVKSSRSRRTTHSTRTMLQKLLAQDANGAAGASPDVDRLSARASTIGSYFDVSDDEESRFYQDERRYMPLFVKKPEMRKGNSRKALKFLGLA